VHNETDIFNFVKNSTKKEFQDKEFHCLWITNRRGLGKTGGEDRIGSGACAITVSVLCAVALLLSSIDDMENDSSHSI
jgi:hypothetical protein